MNSDACERCRHAVAEHVAGHECTARVEDDLECECGGFVDRDVCQHCHGGVLLHAREDGPPDETTCERCDGTGNPRKAGAK